MATDRERLVVRATVLRQAIAHEGCLPRPADLAAPLLMRPMARSVIGAAATRKGSRTLVAARRPMPAIETGASAIRGRLIKLLTRPSMSGGVVACTRVGRATSVE